MQTTTYKQTPIGLIPTDWEVKKLGEITEKIGDGLHGTPIYADNTEYYFVNGNNLKNGIININEETSKVDLTEFKKHKKELNINSILLSINGTIGSLAIYQNEQIVLGKSVAYINCK